MKTTVQLDEFTLAYLKGALWSSQDESTPAGGEPLDANYSTEDFSPDAIARALEDCARFQSENSGLISAAELDSSRAGHCFWLNRNRHGSGFWDEYSSRDPRSIPCDALDAVSHTYPSIDPYPGDDGQIYFS